MAQSQTSNLRGRFGRLSESGAAPRFDADPDHHLWRNGRLWWVAFTVHLPGWQKERVRLSLGTDDVIEARRRRDQLLLEYPALRECELSLRLNGRKTRPRMAPARQVTPSVAA